MRRFLLPSAFLALGLSLGFLVERLASDYATAQASPSPSFPTIHTHSEAIAAGWIEGTDGYWEFRTGTDY